MSGKVLCVSLTWLLLSETVRMLSRHLHMFDLDYHVSQICIVKDGDR